MVRRLDEGDDADDEPAARQRGEGAGGDPPGEETGAGVSAAPSAMAPTDVAVIAGTRWTGREGSVGRPGGQDHRGGDLASGRARMWPWGRTSTQSSSTLRDSTTQSTRIDPRLGVLSRGQRSHPRERRHDVRGLGPTFASGTSLVGKRGAGSIATPEAAPDRLTRAQVDDRGSVEHEPQEERYAQRRGQGRHGHQGSLGHDGHLPHLHGSNPAGTTA